MRHLIPRMLRGHLGGLTASFVALVGASALLTALGILLETGLTARTDTERFARAAAVVTTSRTIEIRLDDETHTEPATEEGTLPSDLTRELADIPGVTAAVGGVAFPTQVTAEDGEPLDAPDGRPTLGHGWSAAALAPFVPVAGRPPAAAGEVALDRGLAERADVTVGARVTVAAGSGLGHYTVVGVVAPAHGKPTRQDAVFFSDTEATRLNGTPGRVDAIGVLATPDADPGALADRIRAALRHDDITVSTGDARARAEFPDLGRARADLTELAGTLGGAVVLITTLIVGSTLTLALHQRRRELAVLRAVAATPRQITRLVAGEVAIVATLAGLAGLLPGLLVARTLRWTLTRVGVIPADLASTAGPLPLVVAVAGCVAVAELAAWAAVRRTSRLRPADALRDAAGAGTTGRSDRGRTVLGVALLALGTAASLLPLAFDTIFAVVGAGTGGLVMVVAAVLLGRHAVRVTTRLLAAPVRRRFGTAGHLAVAGALGDVRRLAAATAPLFLAIGFSCVQLFLPATMSAGAARDIDRGVIADHVLTGGPTGVPATVVDRLRHLPGIRAVTPTATTTVYATTSMLGDIEVFDYPALGVDPTGLHATLDLAVRAGDPRALTDDAVALSRTAAGTLGADVGDRVDLHLGDGTPLRPRVVAVYDRGLGFGDVLLPHDTVTAHTTDHRTETVLVRAEPDADQDALRATLTELTHRHPGLGLTDKDAYSAARQATFTLTLFTSALPLVLVYGYLALAVANTLVTTVSGRARELALLRLAGATPSQVLRMFHAEAVLLVGGAVLVGTLVPLPPLVTIGYGLTGHPTPVIPPLLYLAITGTAAAVGTASLLVPARLTLRANPIHAITVRH